MPILGFDDDELAVYFAGTGTGARDDEDGVPDAPEEPVTRTGDLWLLGNHRLTCGYATVATDVGRLLGSVTPLLMVTDPPYGVEHDPDWRNSAGRANGESYGARAVGKVSNDERADWREASALFPATWPCMVIPTGTHSRRHQACGKLALKSGSRSSGKTRFVISRGDYHPQHQPCWYAIRKSKKGRWAGDRSQTTLW